MGIFALPSFTVADTQASYGKRTLGDLINLNRFRKRAERDRAAQEADVNRIKFGRTKTERNLVKHENESQERSLDGHRRESGDET